MTIHLPLWGFALVTIALVGVFVQARFKSTGQWDFVTPLYGAAIFLGAVIFWAALFIGRCSR